MPRAFRITAVLGLLMTQLAYPQADTGAERGKKEDGVKPYDEVITSDAKSDAGLFLTHRVGDKVYFEIPAALLGEEVLWVTQIARTQAGHGYGGTPVGNRVVRWELRGDDVLLRDSKFRIRVTEGSDEAREAVERTSLEPIIMSLPVAAWGKDQAAVVDATDLFMKDLPEFSAKNRLNASGIDAKRSFFDVCKSFPDNIETKVLLTYKLKASSPGSGRGRGGPVAREGDTVTVQLHHSMVRLPEVPMAPRRFDDRVGFFTVGFEEYGDAEDHAVEEVRYITRWRLEKKDPKAEVSEPIKPIVFYVGRGVPARWRAWVKKGIESWQGAFEKAGFKNAILAKDAPSAAEDPDWDAEDARYSTIRWMPSTVENAMGPHVHDPRSGEILEADIIMYHNVLKLVRDWYFVQASPNDPRAQALPLPDDLVGELLAYVVAHEVGHSLGFPHNMKASSAYTCAQLRDPDFTAKYGTEASIMDYGRFNYVAQPGDGARLIPMIGPYDDFAVRWGYASYQNADAESSGLASLVALQKTDRMLRFGGPNPGEDPSQQTEDLGSDAIEATTLGLKNLDRVAARLVEACCREGKNYDLLRNMYDQLISQRNRELGHVANVVGGFVRTNLWYGDSDRVFESVTRDQQERAVAFLNEHGFRVPESLTDPAITLRLEADGAADRILAAQKRLLSAMISDDRVKRMAEHAERFPEEAYLPAEMLEDLRREIWSEIETTPIVVSLYRRNLQRAFVDHLAGFVKQENATTDLPALSRSELVQLAGLLRNVSQEAKDRTTAAHLDYLAAKIREILDEKDKSLRDGRP
ncbi:MAG: zinc-dependent metalloprotease [Planctomycetes bacterium]|nr:zinc-dependent metalloprotease [Planctomycetota bacterium]